MSEENKVKILEEKLFNLQKELEKVKEKRKNGLEENNAEISNKTENTLEESLYSRRRFLKALGAGTAAISASLALPNAAGFEFSSSGSTNLEIGSDGRLDLHGNNIINAQKIGDKNTPIETMYAKSLKTDHAHIASQSPSIVAWEDDGEAVVDTENERYNGSCIFDALQKAIDNKVAEESGNINVMIKPGEYDLTTGILIDKESVDRVCIKSPGWNQAKLNTQNITDSNFVIEINPGPIENGEYSKRGEKVTLSGFELDDSARNSRDIGGIYINDNESVVVSNHSIHGGFKRGIWLRNVWQGLLSVIEVFDCGSSTESLAGIQIGDSRDTGTYQAINHIQCNHLQGSSDQYAYFKACGTATRIDIEYPNVEFGGGRGFVFDSSNGRMKAQIRGAQMNRGTPAIEVIDGVKLEIFGGKIEGDTTCIKAYGTGVPKILISGVRFSGSHNHNAIDITNGWVNISGFSIKDANHGIFINGCGMANIANGTIRDCERAALKLNNCNGHTYNISDLNIHSSAAKGENPIFVDNTNNISISSMAVSSDSAVPALNVQDSENVSINNIVPAGSATDAYEVSSTTLRSDKGSTTLTSGNKSIEVAHNLSETPQVEDISITPASSLGSASEWYISDINSSSFDIKVDSDPKKTVTFSWRAEL